jgi:hypothetical protein
MLLGLLCAIAVSLTLDAARAAVHPPAGGEPGVQTAGPTEASGKADDWRYRWHRGQWWYWLPSERWVIWSEGSWQPYVPGAETARRPSTTRRSYSQNQRVDRQYGAWGPVRYDGFGQPQYPYSRRKTGMRQLGAVPAYGGVRALPGWGGER